MGDSVLAESEESGGTAGEGPHPSPTPSVPRAAGSVGPQRPFRAVPGAGAEGLGHPGLTPRVGCGLTAAHARASPSGHWGVTESGPSAPEAGPAGLPQIPNVPRRDRDPRGKPCLGQGWPAGWRTLGRGRVAVSKARWASQPGLALLSLLVSPRPGRTPLLPAAWSPPGVHPTVHAQRGGL